MAIKYDADGYAYEVPDVGPSKDEQELLKREKLDLSRKKISASKLALEHVEKAIYVLIEVMNNPETKPTERIAAAKEILDRGLGKARQAVEIEGVENGNPIGFEIVTTVVDPKGNEDV